MTAIRIRLRTGLAARADRLYLALDERIDDGPVLLNPHPSAAPKKVRAASPAQRPVLAAV